MQLAKSGLLYILCLGVAGYAIFAYGSLPSGALVHPDMKVNSQAHSLGIYAHIFGSVVALILGPFKFSRYLRQRHKNIHRWLEHIYLLVGVLIGGFGRSLYVSVRVWRSDSQT